MDTYILLISYTDEGARYILKAPARMKTIRESLKKTLGGSLKGLYVTLGAYEIVAIFEAPKGKEEVLAKCTFKLRSVGDVRVTVLKAFEFDRVFSGSR